MGMDKNKRREPIFQISQLTLLQRRCGAFKYLAPLMMPSSTNTWKRVHLLRVLPWYPPPHISNLNEQCLVLFLLVFFINWRASNC